MDAAWVPSPLDRHGFLVPFQKGDEAAMEVAQAASLGVDRAFKLGDTVWMTNGADHGEGAYALAAENGTLRLRAVNQPGRGVARTLDEIQVRFGRGVSFGEIPELKSRRLR